MSNRNIQLSILAITLAAVLVAPWSTRAQDGATIYKSKCASCHGADGKGNPALVKQLGVRDFASPDVKKETDDELTSIIQKGKNKMPAYEKSLKPEQIKGLLAYVRELGNK